MIEKNKIFCDVLYIVFTRTYISESLDVLSFTQVNDSVFLWPSSPLDPDFAKNFHVFYNNL